MKLPQSNTTDRGNRAATWTSKVCKIMAFMKYLGVLGNFLRTFGVQIPEQMPSVVLTSANVVNPGTLPDMYRMTHGTTNSLILARCQLTYRTFQTVRTAIQHAGMVQQKSTLARTEIMSLAFHPPAAQRNHGIAEDQEPQA